MRRALLFTLILAAVAAFLAFDLGQYLTLDALKTSQARLADLNADHPLSLAAGYLLVYIAVTALSLPGATLMTLAGGALFGWLEGLVLVSFASSLGATLAFLTSRFLLRDWVQHRFARYLSSINSGIKRDGAFYLFSLRLVPVFPFFVINLAMGLTPIKTRTFYWVSQIGMLAGTAVYVNAGTQLAQVEQLSGILSPTLLASFVLLGVFPWVAKWALAGFQRRRMTSQER